MNKPHPLADIIKAWADGTPVQYRANNSQSWSDLSRPGNTRIPAFSPAFQYRIKPENVVRFAPVMQMPANSIVVGHGVTTKECASMQVPSHDRLVGVLRLEFTPDTCELVSATLEK